MIRLDKSGAGFEAAFTALVDARREADGDVSRDVATIVRAVRVARDGALRDYTRDFDGHDLDATGWDVSRAERRAALDGLDRDLRAALELAADRITTYHR